MSFEEEKMARSENLRFDEVISNLQSVIDQIKGVIFIFLFDVNLCEAGVCVRASDNRDFRY